MTTTNDNMTKAQLIGAILQLDDENVNTKASLNRLRKADVAAILVDLNDAKADQPEADEEISASRVPDKYRARYAETAKAAGRKAHTATGKATLNNGDDFALLWEAILPIEACQLADQVVPLPDKQTHGDKYGHLNVGMQRMNAGNRIRGAIKREDIKPAKVVKLTKAIIKARPAA